MNVAQAQINTVLPPPRLFNYTLLNPYVYMPLSVFCCQADIPGTARGINVNYEMNAWCNWFSIFAPVKAGVVLFLYSCISTWNNCAFSQSSTNFHHEVCEWFVCWYVLICRKNGFNRLSTGIQICIEVCVFVRIPERLMPLWIVWLIEGVGHELTLHHVWFYRRTAEFGWSCRSCNELSVCSLTTTCSCNGSTFISDMGNI